MASVTVDAGVLAAPLEDATPDEVRCYVETLIEWQNLLNEPWVNICMSGQAEEVLVEEGLYPLHEHLKFLFRVNHIEEYDVNTVVQVAYALLRCTPTLEDFFGVDLLVEALQVNTNPDLLSLCKSQRLHGDLARCLVLIAVIRSHSIADHILLVKPWQGGSEVQVQALISTIEHSRTDIGPLPKPPDFFNGSVSVCQSFQQLITGLDEVAVWKNAHQETEAELAIRVALHKSRTERSVEPQWDAPHKFSLGKDFYKTANECFRANPQSLISETLRAIVETMDHLNRSATHELRTSKAGDAQVRMRNRDQAWRRDITRFYHLHYWKCADGTIEFANVVPHDDFSITY